MEAFDGKNIDALIMGCTHYPVYRPALEKRLPGVRMIDVGEALAEALRPFSPKAAAPARSNTTLRSAAPPLTRSSASWILLLDPAAIRVENAFYTVKYRKMSRFRYRKRLILCRNQPGNILDEHADV